MGNLIKESYKNNESDAIKTGDVYIYDYDIHGNWITKKLTRTYPNDKTIEVIYERKITY